jgi:hypothetical protein
MAGMSAAAVFAAVFAAYVTGHQVADYWTQTGHRRRPLELLARLIGKGEFWDLGDGLASGATAMDQAFHWAFVFAAAIVTAGGTS